MVLIAVLLCSCGTPSPHVPTHLAAGHASSGHRSSASRKAPKHSAGSSHLGGVTLGDGPLALEAKKTFSMSSARVLEKIHGSGPSVQSAEWRGQVDFSQGRAFIFPAAANRQGTSSEEEVVGPSDLWILQGSGASHTDSAPGGTSSPQSTFVARAKSGQSWLRISLAGARAASFSMLFALEPAVESLADPLLLLAEVSYVTVQVTPSASARHFSGSLEPGVAARGLTGLDGALAKLQAKVAPGPWQVQIQTGQQGQITKLGISLTLKVSELTSQSSAANEITGKAPTKNVVLSIVDSFASWNKPTSVPRPTGPMVSLRSQVVQFQKQLAQIKALEKEKRSGSLPPADSFPVGGGQ